MFIVATHEKIYCCEKQSNYVAFYTSLPLFLSLERFHFTIFGDFFCHIAMEFLFVVSRSKSLKYYYGCTAHFSEKNTWNCGLDLFLRMALRISKKSWCEGEGVKNEWKCTSNTGKVSFHIGNRIQPTYDAFRIYWSVLRWRSVGGVCVWMGVSVWVWVWGCVGE